MSTIHSLVAAARHTLTAAGVPDAEAALDARLLAEFILGWDAAGFLTASQEAPPRDFSARYDALIARRTRREPIAYITGVQEFWGLPIEVTPDVLIPRPETELVIEMALPVASGAAFRAADLCTGSGCLAVALAIERPAASIVATDVSARALAVAARNAERHHVAARLQLVQADLFGSLQEPFELVVCNPPYVPDGDRAALQPEVRDHEPPDALFAGADGLNVIRRLVAEAPRHLAANGTLVFEFGFGQASAVEELISTSAALTLKGLYADLQGIPRVAVARRTT